MKDLQNDLIIEGDRIIEHQPAISDKTLRLNLNKNIYGTFSEIGAGQETVRHFFRSGGSSRTIAKAMSAYDKEFSDAIYTTESDGRYVTESRLKKMLLHESNLMEERLTKEDNPKRMYFSYANTVATIDFAKKFKGHGWVGIRFQTKPNGDYSEIILHIQFKENDVKLQQQTLGILGVNLIYGAFYQYNDPKKLISHLYDHLDKDQLEIDTINFSGSAFDKVDNRLMSLFLVKNNMASAVMFDAHGKNILPANTLFRKNILVLRGSFRPVTLVNMNMYENTLKQFLEHNKISEENTKVVFEMTLNNLLKEGELDEQDFIDRAELLSSLGQTVMISNFKEYYKVIDYLAQYSNEKIALSIGATNLLDIFDSKYYNQLNGGLFEALGKLFNRNLEIYVYPSKEQNGEIIDSENLKIREEKYQVLYNFFKNENQIIDIKNYDEENLSIYSHEVLEKIKKNTPDWKSFLPESVAKIIDDKKLFQ